jgi:hypothetical protein
LRKFDPAGLVGHMSEKYLSRQGGRSVVSGSYWSQLPLRSGPEAGSRPFWNC